MDGWTKIAAGVALGVAGTIYATNRKVRERLPAAARDLPDNLRRRFESAVSEGKEASKSRREEILRNLEAHTQNHPPRRPAEGAPPVVFKDEATVASADDETHPPSPS